MTIRNSSVFALANSFRELGRLQEALVIYDLLERHDPEFPPYRLNREAVQNTLISSNSSDAEKLKNKIQLDLSTPYQQWLRVAHWISEFGAPDDVDLCRLPADSLNRGEILLSKANAAIGKGDRSGWLYYVNRYFEEHGLHPVELKSSSGQELFFDIEFSKPAAARGGLVTVCMSCFNSEQYVERAIRSLMTQSYENLEIIIIDDNSADSTPDIVAALAREDKRIKFTRNTSNQGTYANRNIALSEARGNYFTVLDADDLALPDRIKLQAEHLDANRSHAAVLSRWLRMNSSGTFLFKSGWGGTYAHEAVATLMIRVATFKEKVGYWDAVRFSADTEYYHRIRKIFGPENIHMLDAPSCVALFHDGSLTTDPITGIDVNGKAGWSPVRSEYAKAWRKWHASAKDLYMPLEPMPRLFVAPEEMLPAYRRR